MIAVRLSLNIVLFFGAVLGAPSCHDVGPDKVFYDPSCSHGQSYGCNAGGQGQNCRFCFAAPEKCGGTTKGPTTKETRTTTKGEEAGGPHPFTVENKCSYTIWPGVLAVRGNAPPFNGGWEMKTGESRSFDLPRNWSGRLWARRNCNFDENGKGPCENGDCGHKLECAGAGGRPPVTLAEWTLDAYAGLDFYDVSNVDGFNIPLSITLQGSHDDANGYRCSTADCNKDINKICPEELQERSKSGQVLGCKSACFRFGTDNYCCAGAHDTPEKCTAKDWPRDYPKIFKDACPKAYSYAYDDKASTFTCKGTATGYKVTFCP